MEIKISTICTVVLYSCKRTVHRRQRSQQLHMATRQQSNVITTTTRQRVSKAVRASHRFAARTTVDRRLGLVLPPSHDVHVGIAENRSFINCCDCRTAVDGDGTTRVNAFAPTGPPRCPGIASLPHTAAQRQAAQRGRCRILRLLLIPDVARVLVCSISVDAHVVVMQIF